MTNRCDRCGDHLRQPGGVSGFSQAYFEIDHLAVAPSYRVTVWDYTFIEARGFQ